MRKTSTKQFINIKFDVSTNWEE